MSCCFPIRKPQKPRPTLKELAEEFIAQQKAIELLRIQEVKEEPEMEEVEVEESKLLNKDASFVTTGEIAGI